MAVIPCGWKSNSAGLAKMTVAYRKAKSPGSCWVNLAAEYHRHFSSIKIILLLGDRHTCVNNLSRVVASSTDYLLHHQATCALYTNDRNDNQNAGFSKILICNMYCISICWLREKLHVYVYRVYDMWDDDDDDDVQWFKCALKSWLEASLA